MFFLPISTFIDNLLLILLVLVTFFVKIKFYQLKQIGLDSLLLFFVYILMLGLITMNFETKEYIKLLPLVVIPYILTYIRKEIILNGLCFLLIAVVIKQLISIYGIIDYYYFMEGKKVALRSYAGINEILGFERPYLGFFSALNVIIAYYFFKDKRIIVFILICFLSIVVVALISARLGLIIILASLFCMLLSNMKKVLKYIVISLSLIILILFTQTNNPLKNRFQQIKYDTRLIVWEGALKISAENSDFIFGLKSQYEIKKRLIYFYENEVEFDYLPDKIRFMSKKYNTHNQYLNEILRGGGIAIILLLLPFSSCLYFSVKNRNLTFTLLLLSVLVFFLVENVLARQIGIYITAIILSLTRKVENEEN